MRGSEVECQRAREGLLSWPEQVVVQIIGQLRGGKGHERFSGVCPIPRTCQSAILQSETRSLRPAQSHPSALLIRTIWYVSEGRIVVFPPMMCKCTQSVSVCRCEALSRRSQPRQNIRACRLLR